MKQYLLLLCTLVALGSFSACKNAGDAAQGDATEQSAAGAAEGGALTNDEEPRQNVSEQFSGQFSRMGIQLDDEQLKQVEAIAAKYDFTSAPDRETRKALRQQFQKEVFDVVLSPEQRASAQEQREEIKANRPEQQ